MDLLKAITQSILAQKQHPGPFLETREQELSFGTKINGIFCFIVGDISFLSFDRGYIFPTVVTSVCVLRYIAAKIINSTEINGYIWDCEYSILNQCNDREKWRLTTKIQRHPIWSIYLQIFERIRIPKISMDTDKTLPNRLPTSKTGWEDSGLSIFRRNIDWWIQGCNRRRNNSQEESLADEILYLNKPLKMRKLFYFLITK